MTSEDIIRMAREAFVARGFWPNEVMWQCWKDAWLAGAAAEREACAKVVDEMEKQRCEAWHQVLTKGGEVPSMSLTACAAAIRARGQA